MTSLRQMTALAGAITLVSAAAIGYADDRDKDKRDRFGKGESATPYSLKFDAIRADNCKDGCMGVATNPAAQNGRTGASVGASVGKTGASVGGDVGVAGKGREILVAHITSGRVGGALGLVGGTSLEGVNFAIVGSFGGDVQAKNGAGPELAKRQLGDVHLFIDSKAKTEQKDALRRIFGSSPFVDIVHDAQVTEIPIEFTKGENDTDVWTAKVGEGTLTFEPKTGQDGKPTKVENPPYIFDVKTVVIGKTRGTLDFAQNQGQKQGLGRATQGGEMRLEIQDGCGEVGTIAIDGEIPAAVVPAGSKTDQNGK